MTFELNMDGLVGPTHHYAGLSKGNIASTTNALIPASPKQAALQGIQKMRLMHNLGLKQGFLPPHPRPNLKLLHRLGFTGAPTKLIEKAYREAPKLLSAAFSASSMWTANAATVSASVDTADNRVHFTAANLIGNVHRSQEAWVNHALLKAIFNHPDYFVHHEPLPATMHLGDEGAANHCRLAAQTYSGLSAGSNLLIYGRDAFNLEATIPQKYPARQTLEASEAIARLHGLNPQTTVFAKQNPQAIDAGVFHHDVIGLSNDTLVIVHELAFEHQTTVIASLKKINPLLNILEIPSTTFNLEDAVLSYFFNSQLVTLPDGTMALIAPTESEQNKKVLHYIQTLKHHTPIQTVHFLNLTQSMRNGGGPACLRLRVPLKADELNAMQPQILVTEARLAALENWVNQYYRDTLSFDDLRDPLLIDECYQAYEALSKLINIDLMTWL